MIVGVNFNKDAVEEGTLAELSTEFIPGFS